MADRGDNAPGRSLRGPIAVLCNVRLAALALASVVLAAAGSTSWIDLSVLLAALPLSFGPLRRAARGPLQRVSVAFAAADGVGVLAVLVVAGLDSLALGYVAGSLVLTALWRGAGTVWCLFTALAGLHVLALVESPGTTTQTAGVLARVLLLAAVAYAGVRLRELLLTQERLDEQVQAERLRTASEAERARLAREMHDSLAKTLHGTHLLATVLATRLRKEGSCAAAEVEVIADAVDTARQDARRLLVELRRDPVDSLVNSLRSFGAQWPHVSPVLELDLPAQDPPLSPDAREELSRAAGELLENVVRHARAQHVVVRLRAAAGAVEVEVRDDGVGLPSVDLAALYRTGHFGLIGVRERMARIGGTLALRGRQPHGTVVVLTAPPPEGSVGSRSAVAGVVPAHARTRADLVP